ncbi:MAG: aquaporin [Candidatus Peribacteraceae bacterium]|nr:aquaporin [Candidatus Peribacteraceae bacterium]
MQKMYWRKYTAELLGTAILTFAVLTALKYSLPLSVPVVAGLTLGLLVYIIGQISGAHVNPAVTIGLWSIRKMDAWEALKYVVAQVLGAVIVLKAAPYILGDLPIITVDASGLILFAEALGAFLLLLGICAVVHNKVSSGASGLTIGGSLLLGILLAMATSNGVLNPAVAIGIGSVSWAYLSGPLIGAVVACWLYRWMAR